jgi:hypothetical protein
MRRALIVACTLAALGIAPSAHAALTIGSTLGATPDTPLMGPATASQLGVTAPSSGVITRWRVKAGADSSPVRLRVLRPGGNEVDRSVEVTPPPGAVTLYESSIAIQAGDRIALECCGGDGGTFFAPSPGTTEIWTPPIGDDAPIPAPSATQSWETMINADIEPDLDGDGAGDETQDTDDDDDTRADTADNCPLAPNPGQEDADRDGAGDACDVDRDGDGFVNTFDACPDLAGVAPSGCAPVVTPPPPRVNTPAIVRFRTPFVGTEVGPSQLIELDVFDDFGTPTVTVFDDDGTVCTLRGAPYTCTWNPTGADVGRATLLASAVDADNRSSLASVRVRVARFKATLTRRVKGRKVTGKLRLPAAVERALGCAGEVTVRRGKVRRTTKLKRNCTYSVRLPPGKGKPRARFGGNAVVAPT